MAVKRAEKELVLEYGEAGPSCRILFPRNVRTEEEEIKKEMEARPYEHIEGVAHSAKPQGRRWLGKKFRSKGTNTGKHWRALLTPLTRKGS